MKLWLNLGLATAFNKWDLEQQMSNINRADGTRFSSSYFKPSIRQALLDIQTNRKATISCNRPGLKSQFDSLCKVNTTPDQCAKAKLCCWHGGLCRGSSDSTGNYGATLGESVEFKEAMKSTEKPESVYDHQVLQNQMRHAVSGSKSALDRETKDNDNPEARSAFIGFLNDPMSLSNMFNAPAGLNYAKNGLLSRYTQCPLNVPFCHREKCLNAAGQEPQTAFECYSIAGCCFDSNLYLYRLSFGPGFMSSTAVCHRAIRTPMFQFFTGQLINMNSGMFMPSLMEAVSNKIIDFANTQSGHSLMMEFHQCPLGNGLGSATMRFHYQMAQIWPMYSILRAKGSQITDDLIDALSPYCGWPGITRAQCMLKGCCWSLKNTKCTAPLDLTGHNQESVQSAALALLLRTGDESAKAAVTRSGYLNAIQNGVAYTPSKSPMGPLGLAGLGLSVQSNGNEVTQGFSLPPDTANSETGDLSSIMGKKKRRRRSARERRATGSKSGLFNSGIFKYCENPMLSMMIPTCQKMQEMKQKMDYYKNMMSGFNGQLSSPKGDNKPNPNNGARFLNLFTGGSNSNPFANAFGDIYSQSLDQNGLLLGSLADSMDTTNPLTKMLLMQTMMGANSGLGSSYYTQQQYSQTSPQAFTPQFGTTTSSSNKPTDTGGSSYTATSITSMYDSITQNGKTDVEQCPPHTQADHSSMASCMAPYDEGENPSFERLGQDRMACKAKGCCWDNDINKGVLLSQTVANRLCLWKIPIDGQRWGLPDLEPSMSGCCRQHPCRRLSNQNFAQGYNSVPTQPQPVQQPAQQPIYQPVVNQPITNQQPTYQAPQQTYQPTRTVYQPSQPVSNTYQPIPAQTVQTVPQAVVPTAGPYQPPPPQPVQTATLVQPSVNQPVSSWPGSIYQPSTSSQSLAPAQPFNSPQSSYQVPATMITNQAQLLSGSRTATLGLFYQ